MPLSDLHGVEDEAILWGRGDLSWYTSTSFSRRQVLMIVEDQDYFHISAPEGFIVGNFPSFPATDAVTPPTVAQLKLW